MYYLRCIERPDFMIGHNCDVPEWPAQKGHRSCDAFETKADAQAALNSPYFMQDTLFGIGVLNKFTWEVVKQTITYEVV